MKDRDVKKLVREGYAEIALKGGSSCGCGSSCCGSITAEDLSKGIGYSDEDLKAVPEGANLGLGCGNPIALASLKKGETVLDLGSGAGFDCFLAAQKVGKKGKVIGVDMTPEMLARARENAENGGYQNVEFRLGEIENLPVADSSVDAIISNCVINLSPDKKRVFKEAFRVLQAGGRLMVSDIVLEKPLPDVILNSVAAYAGCIAGASLKSAYLAAIRAAGFKKVRVMEESTFSLDYAANDPAVQAVFQDSAIHSEAIREAAGSVTSVRVAAVKPA